MELLPEKFSVHDGPIKRLFSSMDTDSEKAAAVRYFLSYIYINDYGVFWHFSLNRTLETRPIIITPLGCFIADWNERCHKEKRARLRIEKKDDYHYTLSVCVSGYVTTYIDVARNHSKLNSILAEFGWFGYGPKGVKSQST